MVDIGLRGNYTGSISKTLTFVINRAPVTITAQSHSFIYNGEAQRWNHFDVEGLCGDDAISGVVSGSITFPNESPVYNKVESYQFISGDADNYVVTTQNGELTMEHASVPITLTAASESWVYDGSAHSNGTVALTSGSLLPGDELVAEASGSVTKVAETAEGNNPVAGYKIMHGDEDVTASYVITTVAGTLTVTPKPVTVSGLEAVSRAYESGNLSVALTGGVVSGKGDGDDVSVDLNAATGTMTDANAGADKPVTVSGVKLGCADAANYTITAQPTGVSVTVTKAAARTLADLTMERIYALNSVAASVSGLMPADAGELSYTAGAPLTTGSITVSDFTVSDAGAVSATFANGAAGDTFTLPAIISSTNYKDSTVNVVVTLSAKDNADVTLNGGQNVTAAYGDSLTLSAAAEHEGENGVWTWSSSDPSVATVNSDGDVTIKQVGETEITASCESDTTLGSDTILLTVNPASVTLTANSGEYTYDGTEKTITGFTSSVSGLTFTGVTVNETKDSTGNYVVTGTTNGTLTITPKSVTVKADDKTKVYDNDATTDPALTATVTGAVEGDTINYTLSRAEGQNVGEYEIIVTLGENPNYDVTATNGTFTITKAAQEVPAAPTAQEVTDHSITLTPADGMEYRIGNGEWQTDNFFTGLETGTVYSFYQLLAADDNHEASESSEAAEISTSNSVFEKFVDVPYGSYFYDPVYWAVAKGITAGTSSTTFSPDAACTRSQIVQFLWRAAGSPEPETTECKFTDVNADAYYYKAVLWAVENGITAGVSET